MYIIETDNEVQPSGCAYKHLPHPALTLGYQSKKEFCSLEERLQNALRIMAKVIAEQGEAYLPIFERLEEELEAHRSKKGALQRALALSEES